MIEDERGSIDYDECGSGPALVFVPGSCSTGAAWRPVIAALNGQCRCVTTSLLGYGRTAERRTAADTSIRYEAEIVEAVVRKTGGEVHLVGHSFGGLVAVAVALREQVSIRSLIILEAPATELLRELNEDLHYHAFNEMTAKYFAAFAAGRTDAIASMIDFYGGAGTYASWPARVRTYAVETTPVNIMDWATASDLSVTPVSLAAIAVRTLVVCGGASHPAMQRVNVLLGRCIPGASFASIRGAAHFMIASHSGEVARLIAGQVSGGAARTRHENSRYARSVRRSCLRRASR